MIRCWGPSGVAEGAAFEEREGSWGLASIVGVWIGLRALDLCDLEASTGKLAELIPVGFGLRGV